MEVKKVNMKKTILCLAVMLLPVIIFAEEVLTSKTDVTPEVTAEVVQTPPATPPATTPATTPATPPATPPATTPVVVKTPEVQTQGIKPVNLIFDDTQPYKLKLSWDAQIKDGVNYNVYRKNNGDNYEKINPTPFSGTAYTDITVQPGGNYTYKVQAVKDEKEKKESAELNVTLKEMEKIVPDVLLFENHDVSKAVVRWTPLKDGLTYNIYRKEKEGAFVMLNEAPFTQSEFTDETIRPGAEYAYKLEALDESGFKSLSAENIFKAAEVTPAGKPLNFRAYQDVERIILKWETPIKGSFEIAGYNIYRSTSPTGPQMYKFVEAKKNSFNDEDVKGGIKYYYFVKAKDVKENESEQTATEPCIAFPGPRTGLILMPTAFRNDIFDNFGVNADMAFSYYIGSIYGEHDINLRKGNDSFTKIGVWLLSADIRLTALNETANIPSVGVGYTYSIMLQDSIGSSDTTGVGVTIGSNDRDSLKSMMGTYAVVSKELFWDFTFHTGYILGDYASFIPYLTRYADTDRRNFNSYFVGFGRPLFSKMGVEVEYVVPANINKNPFLPDTYLINTHIDRFINFDVAYLKYPGGYAWLGYINFRFTIFPNPYKVQ